MKYKCKTLRRSIGGPVESCSKDSLLRAIKEPHEFYEAIAAKERYSFFEGDYGYYLGCEHMMMDVVVRFKEIKWYRLISNIRAFLFRRKMIKVLSMELCND